VDAVKRLMIRLPDPAHAALEQRALQAGEPLASTAAGLLRTVLVDGDETKPARRVRSPRPGPRSRSAGAAPGAPWIASDDDPDWHRNTWGAIVALHKRYPRALAKLKHDWHEHPDRAETLAALAVWRANIDAAGEDPREELAFHNALQQLSRILDQTPPTGRPFKPDASMPAEWGKPRNR
jgi:hypothetical protein